MNLSSCLITCMELLRFAPSWGAAVLRPYGELPRRCKPVRWAQLCVRSRLRLPSERMNDLVGQEQFGSEIISSGLCGMVKSFLTLRDTSRRTRHDGTGTGRILKESRCLRPAKPVESQVRPRLGVRGAPLLRHLLEGGAEKIDQQANGGLRRAAAGIAIGIYFDYIHAHELSFFRNPQHQFVNFGECQDAGFGRPRAGRQCWIHGVDVEGDVNIPALRNSFEGCGNAAAMDFLAGHNLRSQRFRVSSSLGIIGDTAHPDLEDFLDRG